MNKEELEKRLEELKEKGYGKTKDLARELEYAIVEYFIDRLEDDEICSKDLEVLANDILENIFEVQLEENLEEYIDFKE